MFFWILSRFIAFVVTLSPKTLHKLCFFVVFTRWINPKVFFSCDVPSPSHSEARKQQNGQGYSNSWSDIKVSNCCGFCCHVCFFYLRLRFLHSWCLFSLSTIVVLRCEILPHRCNTQRSIHRALIVNNHCWITALKTRLPDVLGV